MSYLPILYGKIPDSSFTLECYDDNNGSKLKRLRVPNERINCSSIEHVLRRHAGVSFVYSLLKIYKHMPYVSCLLYYFE